MTATRRIASPQKAHMLGTKLADRYEIVSELGRGGMGVVYRARDPLLNRDVAVKLIPPSQLTCRRRAALPARGAARRADGPPAIVPIYDFGRHEDALFFVMPLVQRHEPARRSCARIASSATSSTSASRWPRRSTTATARGVVHRDIKPENIMVAREDGAGVRVRVMDFGLARATIREPHDAARAR